MPGTEVLGAVIYKYIDQRLMLQDVSFTQKSFRDVLLDLPVNPAKKQLRFGLGLMHHL